MSKQANKPRFPRLATALAVIALTTASGGCVERRMTIRSNPPGAAVYVDDYQIGTTPVAANYTYYGTRKIRLVKDGYETLTVYQPMPPPWYDVFGIDFFSENIWPGKIRDERSYEFQMAPAVAVSIDDLRGRAESLRNSSRVIPAAAVQPIVAPPQVLPAETLPQPVGPLVLPPTTLPPATLPPTILPPTTLPPATTPLPSAGSTSPIYPAPGQSAPATAPYIAPNYATPGFSSPGGFGVGGPGSPTPSGAPMPLFPSDSAPAPQYVPPPTTAPTTPPPTTAPPPYSIPPGWRPLGQLPADTEKR
jgi:PEGA domain